MSDEERPLSALASQGWEVLHYSASVGDSSMLEHCFHLRRQGRHMILRLRKKMLGSGVVAEEIEI